MPAILLSILHNNGDHLLWCVAKITRASVIIINCDQCAQSNSHRNLKVNIMPMHLSVPHRYNRSAVFLWKIKAPLPQVYNKREKPLPDHKTTENSAIDLSHGSPYEYYLLCQVNHSQPQSRIPSDFDQQAVHYCQLVIGWKRERERDVHSARKKAFVAIFNDNQSGPAFNDLSNGK